MYFSFLLIINSLRRLCFQLTCDFSYPFNTWHIWTQQKLTEMYPQHAHFLSLSDLQINMQQLSWGEMNVVLNCDNFLSLGFFINTCMIPPLTFSSFIDLNVFVCVYIYITGYLEYCVEKDSSWTWTWQGKVPRSTGDIPYTTRGEAARHMCICSPTPCAKVLKVCTEEACEN